VGGMSDHELDTLAEAVAVRVVELLRQEGMAPVAGRPLTVREVGRLFDRSPDWVRDNRQRLGVLPAEGERPRLLFDPQAVERAMRATSAKAEPAKSKPYMRRRRRVAPERELLPIRGRL
jgi:hypothetical protein